MNTTPSIIEVLEPRQLLTAVPAGPAFQITGPGTQGTGNTAIAADANGDLAAVWQPIGTMQVLAQRMMPNGVPIGAPILVGNGSVDGEGPKIAMNAAGSFVVTWDQAVPVKVAGQSGWYWQVHAREFDVGTGALSSDLLVNSADSMPHVPSVAMNDNGGFVVVWRDTPKATGVYRSGDPLEAFARLYSEAAAALTSRFQVNTSGSDVTCPRTGMDSAGDFVVAWADGGLSQVFARRYNPIGAATTGQISVGSGVGSGYDAMDASMDSVGDCLVVWNNSGVVDAQRYLSSGVGQWASPVQLGGDGVAAAVCSSMDGAGNAIVAWDQKNPVQGEDLYEQQFDNSGSMLGGVQNVTPYDPATGGSAAVSYAIEGLAEQPDDGFVISWVNNQSTTSTPGFWSQQYVQQ